MITSVLLQQGSTPRSDCRDTIAENVSSKWLQGAGLHISHAGSGRARLTGTQPRLPYPSRPQRCLQLSATGPQRGPCRQLWRPCAPQRCLEAVHG